MKVISTLNTEQLHLRLPELSDAQKIFEEYAQDLEVCKYMTWTPIQRLEDYEAWLQEKIEDIGRSSLTYVICPKGAPADVVGMIDAKIDGFKADIGYALAKRCWGKGYMTEALKVFLDLLFSQESIYRAFAVHDLDNPASGRVMEKSGMEFEGILKSYIIHPNVSSTPRDVKCYAKTK